MRATANQSARCKKPVYHLAIAWHEDENPTDDMMREVGAQTLKDLELEEHQALFIAHKDTAHKHLHIVINRVHPETAKAWNNSNDYKRIEISLRKQAEARGLPYVPGRFNDPSRFAGKGRGARDGEYQAAVRHGKPAPKSMWSRDDIKALRGVLVPTFAGASSWDELGAAVSALGFRLSPKGQGLIIEGADGYMKLSDLGKEVRVKALEDSFGESYAAYTSRTAAIPDEALQEGANILSGRDGNSLRPGGSQRRKLPGHAPHSASEGSDDDDGFVDTVRDQARQEWSRRRAASSKPKPVDGGDDDALPGELPHPDADPRQLAYIRVREARAVLAKVRQDSLRGDTTPEKVIDAQLQLEEARRDLEALLVEASQARAALPVPFQPAPPPAPAPVEPSSRHPPPPVMPKMPFAADPVAARGDAFNGLRAARQAQDLAEALFNAGVIGEDELEAATEAARRAAEQLRPHLSAEEQLKNDIAQALRKRGKSRAPDKGGPSR